MRKSRFLTLFLTVVFILANVSIPSFAALLNGLPEVDGATYAVTAPIAGKAFRVSIVENGEGDEYSHGRGSSTYPYLVRDGGLISLPADAFSIAGKTGVGSGKLFGAASYWTQTNGTQYIKFSKVYGSFNYTFDDEVLPQTSGQWLQAAGNPMWNNLEIASDASGRVYATPNAKSTVRPQGLFLSRETINIAPFVVEMELKNFRDDFTYTGLSVKFLDLHRTTSEGTQGAINMDWVNAAVAAGATKGTNFDFENFSAYDGEWHKFKWIMTPDAYTVGEQTISQHFDLYIDDKLVLGNVYNQGNSSNTSFRTTGGNSFVMQEKDYAIDNLRRYGTTLGFAYDASLASTGNTVGSTLTATAGHATMPVGNIDDALEYAFYTVDTVDGAFNEENIIQQGATATYTLTEEDAGEIIKVAARVKEDIDNGYASDWVIADEYVEVTAAESTPAVAITVDGVEKDITAENIIADAGSAAIAITINEVPAGADKFVLAQYAKVASKPVLKSVVSTANTTINLSASDLSADSEFKLFMLTESGLIPKNVISFK